MEARRPISVAVNYEVDESSSQPTIAVMLLSDQEHQNSADWSGVALLKSETALPSTAQHRQSVHHPHSDEEDDMAEQDEQPEPVKLLEEEARFDEITVWGHDRLPAADDTFVKGIEEWIAFAEAVGVASPGSCSRLNLVLADSLNTSRLLAGL